MRILIVVLYLIATGLLVGAGWFARPMGAMPLIMAIGVFHVLIGALIVRRFGRRGDERRN